MAASVFQPRTRLTVDTNLGVKEYRTFLADFMSARKTRDLKALTSPLSVLTWKCSPKAWALSDFSDLLKYILLVEKRGILSHKVLCDAIQEESTKSEKGQVSFFNAFHTQATPIIFSLVLCVPRRPIIFVFFCSFFLANNRKVQKKTPVHFRR